MTSTPDRRSARWRGGVLALAVALVAPAAAAPGLADNLVHDAHVALARGDGVAAEISLRKAMAAGLSRDAVAARMGEAYLDQGDRTKAREWLAPARFIPAEAAHGWRMLGRLEMADCNLAAAGQAFDHALALTPRDSRLWVDIARLRYVGGQQRDAVNAADQAVRLDPGNVRALEFRGLLVRDAWGLAAALPWFEAGLKLRPDDVSLLGEYAATLGELGRARQMLTVTRRMIELEPHNPRAFFLQSVLAARAGNTALARSLLARTRGAFAGLPAASLLEGALALDAGNANQAVGWLDPLVRQQPRNSPARLLLARALYAAGAREQLLARFSAEAARADASPYLLTLLGRAHEDLGQRDLAAPLLDRAARAGAPGFVPVPDEAPLGVLALRYADAPDDAAAAVPYARQLLAAGRGAEATRIAEEIRTRAPASYDAQLLAGDLRLSSADLGGAVEAWRLAAQVRLSDDLLARLVRAYGQAGRRRDAVDLVQAVLDNSPRNRVALRLAAGFSAEAGDWGQAATVLDWLSRTGDARDARLQADLALARLRAGQAGAEDAARNAWSLQRSSPLSAQALGMVLAASRREPRLARVALDQARAIGGNNPLLAESEARLALSR